VEPTDAIIAEFYLWYYKNNSEQEKFLTPTHIIKAWEEWKTIQERIELDKQKEKIFKDTAQNMANKIQQDFINAKKKNG